MLVGLQGQTAPLHSLHFAFVFKNLTKNFTISGVFLFIAELLPPHSQ